MFGRAAGVATLDFRPSTSEGGYTVAVHSHEWRSEVATEDQLESLLAAAGSPGYLVVSFDDGADGAAAPWPAIERWTRSRAVTVADVRGSIRGGALEVAA